MSNGQPDDSYVTARANLRDTIKWLIAAFAAVAAAIVGSTPFTHIGLLRGYALVAALACAAIGFGCILWALNRALKLLVPRPFFLSDIAKPAYGDLAKLINDRGRDILPPGLSTVEQFLENRRDTLDGLLILKSATPRDEEKIKDLEASLTATRAVSSHLTNLAYYEHLRRAFDESRKPLFVAAITGAAFLTLFAWITTGGEASAQSTPLHVILDNYGK